MIGGCAPEQVIIAESTCSGHGSPPRSACAPPSRAIMGPAGRTARLVEEGGVLVSAGDTPVDDDVLFGLIDGGRK
jgi:hypothetical protein